ncbi:MAG: DNA cytosine methyltransferase [Pirellulales bacterium]|nr:DNA cytosine methyltransferase [Pirellulales bacterium]
MITATELKKGKRVVREKIKRIRSGNSVRTLDLFAGCGGLSLGMQASGFDVVASVEFDKTAARTHGINFFPECDTEVHSKARDIVPTEPSDLVAECRLGRSLGNSIDVIVGGPPCQAFARVGRAKLREIDEHPQAFLNDARGNLYLRYLHYVSELLPLALLMENVPDAMNYGGHNIAEEVCEVLKSYGYVASYTLLNSAYFGVPQMRERMFLIAYREELDVQVRFPEPTHYVDLPPGYKGSRDVATKALRNSHNGQKRFGFEETCYQEPPRVCKNLEPAVTTQQAIQDLPPITLHLDGKLKKAAQRLDKLTNYDNRRKLTPYGRLMRSWSGFENDEGIYDHVIRYLPRDYQIFRVMEPGDQYPQAHDKAMRIFHDELAKRRRKGEELLEGSDEYEALKKSIVPPYDPSKFPNKWRKLESFLPSRTLLAHIGKDTYSHIHYDSEQARTISVREAARLQSFPDGFRFAGSMNAALRQIGNAVPPLMAKALGGVMKQVLEGEDGS